MTEGIPAPRGVTCATLTLARQELLLIEFPLPEPVLPPGLTPAEEMVVGLLLRGSSPREIARVRGSSLNTVRNQIRSVHKKLAVSSISELARRCFEHAGDAR